MMFSRLLVQFICHKQQLMLKCIKYLILEKPKNLKKSHINKITKILFTNNNTLILQSVHKINNKLKHTTRN